jgi:hypothetical protein
MESEPSFLVETPEGLDALVAELNPLDYRAGRWPLLHLTGALALMATGAAMIGLPAFWLATIGKVPKQVAELNKKVAGFLFIAGIALLLWGSLWAVRSLRHWGRRVLVFSAGVVHIKGRRVQIFRWEDVQAVWQHQSSAGWLERFHGSPFSFGAPYWFVLRRKDGVEVCVDGYFPGAKELYSHIERAFIRYRFPPEDQGGGESR